MSNVFINNNGIIIIVIIIITFIIIDSKLLVNDTFHYRYSSSTGDLDVTDPSVRPDGE